MAEELSDMTPVLLREIRAKQDEHSLSLSDHSRRFDRLEERLDDVAKIVRYSLGQSAETEFSNPSKSRASTTFSSSWKTC